MKETVKAIMAEVFDVDAASIADDATMETVENWDSMNHIKLVMALEKRFRVTLKEEMIVTMVTLPRILSTLEASGVAA